MILLLSRRTEEKKRHKAGEKKNGAAKIGEGGGPVDSFGVDGVDGKERGGGESDGDTAGKHPEERETERGGDAHEKDAEQVKCEGVHTPCRDEEPVSEHLHGTVINLGALDVRKSPNVGEEELAKRCALLESGVHDDLLLVVPSEAVGKAVGIGKGDEKQEGNDGSTSVEGGSLLRRAAGRRETPRSRGWRPLGPSA